MTHPIACKDAVRRLWDYLDGATDPEEHERIEAHLTFCLRCCGELEFARELREVLRVRTTTALPEDSLLRLRSFIDELPDPGLDGEEPDDDQGDERRDDHRRERG